MKPLSCNLIRSTAAVCVLMVSGIAGASDGVVRISDRSPVGSTDSGVVRISDHRNAGVQPVTHRLTSGAECHVPAMEPGCAIPQGCVCEPGCCASDSCCPAEGCQTYGCQTYGGQTYGGQTYGRDYVCSHSGCGCRSGRGHCSCHGQCCCHGSGCQFGHGHQERMYCLFAGSACSGTGCRAHDFWRGQSLSHQAKNARLTDKLFGWLIPSGFGGQGSPPVGKYQITYAEQPGYADPRDSQIFAAQGYGMPMSVPLAPNVYHQYNYSWGVPASRITPISTWNPQTSPQPLYHQSW